MSRRLTLALAGLLLLLLGLFGWSLAYLSPRNHGRELRLDQLFLLAGENRVATAVFGDEDARITGRYVGRRAGASVVPGTPGGSGSYRVSYPKSDTATAALLQTLAQAGARVSVDPQTAKGQVRAVSTFLLPLMILATTFALLFSFGRGGGAGIGDVITFGSIGQRRLRRGQARPVTFTDVAGLEEAVEELAEVRDYLANPQRYEEIGAQPPKGVLLIGPPGCGKTLLAKAIAGEVGVPFFTVAGAEFVESLVGIGAARVRDLFRRVRAASPAIVFIDELDAAGRKRAVGGGSGGTDEREQTLNQLLVEMDGFEVSSGIVVMGATNRPDILDPALLRPGRFDRHITVDRPDLLGRTKILALHARGKPVSGEVDFAYLARRTPGFSGADLANVINEAALLTVRQAKGAIELADLEEAIQRVLAGPTRRGRVLTPEERKRAAYHEGGHAIVAAASGRFDEVHRVSILARGRTLGSAGVHRPEESALLTRAQLRSRLVALMGGLAAEELVFGEPSTGSERDLEQATDLARDLVARYGMSPKLGRTRLLSKDLDEFLEADVPFAPMSASTMQELDLEVRRLLDEAEHEATRLLVAHRDALDSLTARLEIEETLEGADLEAALTRVRPEVELFGGLLESTDNGARTKPRPRARGRR
jgi:cell division protease FtsH